MRQTKPKYYSILYDQLHSYSYALSFKLHLYYYIWVFEKQ